MRTDVNECDCTQGCTDTSNIVCTEINECKLAPNDDKLLSFFDIVDGFSMLFSSKQPDFMLIAHVIFF